MSEAIIISIITGTFTVVVTLITAFKDKPIKILNAVFFLIIGLAIIYLIFRENECNCPTIKQPEFGVYSEKVLGDEYIADTDGFVIVLNHRTNKQFYSCICGLVAPPEGKFETYGTACMHYKDVNNDEKLEVYIPMSTFTMPVKKGYKWRTEKCSGEKEDLDVSVYWLPIQ